MRSHSNDFAYTDKNNNDDHRNSGDINSNDDKNEDDRAMGKITIMATMVATPGVLFFSTAPGRPCGLRPAACPPRALLPGPTRRIGASIDKKEDSNPCMGR